MEDTDKKVLKLDNNWNEIQKVERSGEAKDKTKTHHEIEFRDQGRHLLL